MSVSRILPLIVLTTLPWLPSQGLAASEFECLLALLRPYFQTSTAPVSGSAERRMVGLPADEFVSKADPEGRGKQRSNWWCWAASTQMVMDCYDIDLPQEVVAKHGVNEAGAGTIESILQANSGIQTTRNGEKIVVESSLVTDPADIVAELEAKRPLIIGINNQFIANSAHEYVLTAAEISIDPISSAPTLHKLVLRNPMPGMPSRKEFDMATEGSRVDHVIKVRVRSLSF